MITAAEARDATLNRYLDAIGEEIKARAKKGDRSYDCYVPDLWEATECHRSPEPTPLQHRVINALKSFENGYGAKWAESGDSYVPRGLANDNGDGPSYQNWCILIKW